MIMPEELISPVNPFAEMVFSYMNSLEDEFQTSRSASEYDPAYADGYADGVLRMKQVFMETFNVTES